MMLWFKNNPKDDLLDENEDLREEIEELKAQLAERQNIQLPTTIPESNDKIFSQEDFDKILDNTFSEVKYLTRSKGREYSGNQDRLANFRRNGEKMRLFPEDIWFVYASKHYDSIAQYILDLRNGNIKELSEPIEGRVDDLIAYLILFKCMIKERKGNLKSSNKPLTYNGTNGTQSRMEELQAKYRNKNPGPKGKLP